MLNIIGINLQWHGQECSLSIEGVGMKLRLGSALIVAIVFAQQLVSLPLCKETDDFHVYCLPADQTAAGEMAAQAELYYDQLAGEFSHDHSQKIELHVYPDFETLHEAMNWPTAPDWIISRGKKPHAINSVSAMNPGPLYSSARIYSSIKNSLAGLFVSDKYHDKEIPRWLSHGVSLYRTNRYPTASKWLAIRLDHMSCMQECEHIDKTAVNYDAFRIGVSKDAFTEQWLAYLQEV